MFKTALPSQFKIYSISAGTALAGLLLGMLPVHADTFDARAAAMLSAYAAGPVPPGISGRQPYGTAVARLAANPGDAEALSFVAGSNFSNDPFFNAMGQARALYMARDRFSVDQIEAIRNRVTGVANWFNTGTENHRLMVWTAGYLFAQAFPNEEWNWAGAKISSAQLMENTFEQIRRVGRNQFAWGYAEFLSPNYEIYHVAPILNLYDYAEDPKVRRVAEAFLHYHFSIIAHGSLAEFALPPFSRRIEQNANLRSELQQMIWLYWGHGSASLPFAASSPMPYFALSSWRPHPLIQAAAAAPGEMNYTAYFQQTHFQWATLRYVVRTTHHNNGISMSSGVQRHIPSAFQLDDSLFGISWVGGAANRLIEAMHPYWRSSSPDAWNGPTSPFMQIGHHRNAAILLFDIPPEDPWAGIGQWAGERVGSVVPLAQIRFPSTLTGAAVVPAADDWFFLRSGRFYIGIRALRSDGLTNDRRSLTEAGFNVLKSRGTNGERWTTGFIVEIGNEDQFGSYEAFQEATRSNPFTFDAENVTATYVNNEGVLMEMAFNGSLEHPDGTIPELFLDDVAVDYVNWPSFQAPWAQIENYVLTIDGAFANLTIDWRGDLPVFSSVDASWADTVTPLPGNLVEVPWYGTYALDGANGWIDHLEHGWQYVFLHGDDAFLYDLGMARWIYASPDFYPAVYVFSENPDWYFYLRGQTDPRLFVRLADRVLVSDYDLTTSLP